MASLPLAMLGFTKTVQPNLPDFVAIDGRGSHKCYALLRDGYWLECKYARELGGGGDITAL